MDLREVAKRKSVKFVVCGVLLTVLQYALNIAFIEWCHLNESLSYAVVLVVLLVLGMVLNRYVVFDRGQTGLAKLTVQYVVLSLVFRGGAWALYAAMVSWLKWHYLIAQTVSLLAFLVAKFFAFRRVFEA